MQSINSFSLVQKLFATLVLLLATGSAFAHTGLKESTPAADATVQAAPAKIDLVFTAPVRLVKLEVAGSGPAVETEFKPSAEAVASYSIPAAGLVAGSYTVNWAAIGADGHTVSDSFSFVVASSSASSAP